MPPKPASASSRPNCPRSGSRRNAGGRPPLRTSRNLFSPPATEGRGGDLRGSPAPPAPNAFAADQEIGPGDIPLLITGRALPEVPPTHRTAFQAFPGQQIDIRTDIPSNTLLLRGTMEMLERAAEMFDALEQRP